MKWIILSFVSLILFSCCNPITWRGERMDTSSDLFWYGEHEFISVQKGLNNKYLVRFKHVRDSITYNTLVEEVYIVEDNNFPGTVTFDWIESSLYYNDVNEAATVAYIAIRNKEHQEKVEKQIDSPSLIEEMLKEDKVVNEEDFDKFSSWSIFKDD